MQRVPLTKVPRQELSVPLDGAYWRIKFYLSLRHVCADIERNGSDLIKGVRCFVGVPLLPYQHLRSPNFGNFYFDNDVDWQTLDDECVLYYLNEQQVKELDEKVNENNWNTVFKNIAAEAEAFHLYNEEQSSSPKYPKVKITLQPQQIEVLLDRPATMVVKAENAISYQWEFAKQESGVAWKTVQGQNSNVLTFNSVSENDFGYYRCIAIGLDSIEISDNAWLKQTKLPMPSFTKNLQKSVDVKSGTPLILSVFSPDAYSYQWQFSKNSTGPWENINGQVTERLNINSTADNNGYFRVIAYGSNGMGASSDVCLVKVWGAIWLPGLNNKITAKVGDKITMSWSGGQNIVNYDIYKESDPSKILQSGTNPVFEILTYTANDAGTYKAKLSNPVESVVSQRSYTLETFIPGPPLQISQGYGYIIGTSVPVEYTQLIKEADSASNVRILYEFITLPENETLNFWDVSSEFTISKTTDTPTQSDRWKFSRSIVGIPVKNLIRYSDPSSVKWESSGLVTAQRDTTNKLSKLTFTGDGTFSLRSFDNDPTIDKVPVGTDCVMSISLLLEAGSFDVSIPNSTAQVWGYVGDGDSKVGQWVRFKIPFKMIGYPSIVASGSDGSVFSIKDVQIDARPIAMPIQRTNGPVTETNVKSENLLTYSKPDVTAYPSIYTKVGNPTIASEDSEFMSVVSSNPGEGIQAKFTSLYAEEYTVSLDVNPLMGEVECKIVLTTGNKVLALKDGISNSQQTVILNFVSGSAVNGEVKLLVTSKGYNSEFWVGNVQVERNPFKTRTLKTTGTTRSEVNYASGEMKVKYTNAYGSIDGTGSLIASIPPGQ